MPGTPPGIGSSICGTLPTPPDWPAPPPDELPLGEAPPPEAPPPEAPPPCWPPP
ncbi:MAG: hypothetical protein GWP64_02735 [Gammaproteobacteria bacterium]|nr:hypothetical protein [Gammaproteobacteria bacterium]